MWTTTTVIKKGYIIMLKLQMQNAVLLSWFRPTASNQTSGNDKKIINK